MLTMGEYKISQAKFIVKKVYQNKFEVKTKFEIASCNFYKTHFLVLPHSTCGKVVGNILKLCHPSL
jgi:hypothetical protein